MTNICQICGKRPALARLGNYTRSHKRGRHVSRGDHDLCRQCWAKNKDANVTRPARGRFDGVLDELMAAAAKVA